MISSIDDAGNVAYSPMSIGDISACETVATAPLPLIKRYPCRICETMWQRYMSLALLLLRLSYIVSTTTYVRILFLTNSNGLLREYEECMSRK